jgi:hypothetical protein
LYELNRSDQEVVGFRLVDKKKVVQIVRLHREDFQELLQIQSIEPEDLFDYKKMGTFLSNVKHEGLIGTLLGFGRNNAWLFATYKGIDPKERPMISAWPEEELVNLEQLNQRTFAFQSWQLSDLFYPRFACDPKSEETQQLKQSYRKERDAIIAYFEGKDLVESVLSLFNQT